MNATVTASRGSIRDACAARGRRSSRCAGTGSRPTAPASRSPTRPTRSATRPGRRSRCTSTSRGPASRRPSRTPPRHASSSRRGSTARSRSATTRSTVRCPGQRDHSWGVRDWWLFGWVWCSGRLDDGTWWHTARSIVPNVDIFQTGYVIAPGMQLTPVEKVDVDYELDTEQLPVAGTLVVGDLGLRWTAELHAPVLLVSPEGKRSRFPLRTVPVRDRRRPQRARLDRVQLPRGRRAPQELNRSRRVLSRRRDRGARARGGAGRGSRSPRRASRAGARRRRTARRPRATSSTFVGCRSPA